MTTERAANASLQRSYKVSEIQQEVRKANRLARDAACAEELWTDPKERLHMICSTMEPSEIAALAQETARLRREIKRMRSEPACGDEFDVLSDVLPVPRDGAACTTGCLKVGSHRDLGMTSLRWMPSLCTK